MTNDQKIFNARQLCEMKGINPDELITLGDSEHPAWKVALRDIEKMLERKESILEYEVVCTTYKIPVSVEDMQKIINRDDEVADNARELFRLLDGITGVELSEYDMWFGPYIYFNIKPEHDNDETMATVSRTIIDAIEGRI